jgi:hypothetical protein
MSGTFFGVMRKKVKPTEYEPLLYHYSQIQAMEKSAAPNRVAILGDGHGSSVRTDRYLVLL